MDIIKCCGPLIVVDNWYNVCTECGRQFPYNNYSIEYKKMYGKISQYSAIKNFEKVFDYIFCLKDVNIKLDVLELAQSVNTRDDVLFLLKYHKRNDMYIHLNYICYLLGMDDKPKGIRKYRDIIIMKYKQYYNRVNLKEQGRKNRIKTEFLIFIFLEDLGLNQYFKYLINNPKCEKKINYLRSIY